MATAIAALILVTGCTSAGYVPTATPWPVPTGPHPTADAVAFPMPDIGPMPPDGTITDSEEEALRLADLELNWKQVLSFSPDAVRPEVTFTGYVAEGDRPAAHARCFDRMGIATDEGRNADDVLISVEPVGYTAATVMARYTCTSEAPSRPLVPLTDDQLSWVYDYLTLFLAPCYLANGHFNVPAPARADFIERWPHQNWYPTPGDAPMGTAEDAALQLACPSTPPYTQQ